MPVCLRSASIRLRRVQASSSVDCRREPPRAAIASQPAPPTRCPIVLDLRHGPRTLPLPLPGSRRRKRARTPRALNQVGTKPPDRWDNADRNPAPAPQSKPSNPCLPPRGAERAVGGIRAWTENSGRRASHLPTVLLLRRLWAPIPKFVATAMNQGARPKRCLISQIGRLHASRRSIVKVGPLSAATARFSRAGPRRARPASR